MEGIKTLTDLTLNNKRVLVRVDFNVPLSGSGKEKTITDDNRIKQAAPTIKKILEMGGRPVLMSHLGSPGGKADPELSLAPCVEKLKKYLPESNIIFALDCVGAEVEKLSHSLEPNQIMLVENLRYHKGEESNSPEFASQLAKLGDVFISDAFATAHRSHASMVGVPALFSDKGAGLLMQKEIEYYKRSLINPKRPLCVILGGAKISTKLNALSNIAHLADKIIIGGAMANTFLAAQGIQVGRSLVERELYGKAIELLGSLARRDCKVYLPVDVMVGPGPNASGLARAVPSYEIPADSMALDIGPASRLLFAEAIATSETVVWNGPMGVFENEEYAQGTFSLVEALASCHGLTVVGGGDTDAAIHKMELGHKFDFISTGGGAFLYLLEGKSLPGFEALKS